MADKDKLADIRDSLEAHRKLNRINQEFYANPAKTETVEEVHQRAGMKTKVKKVHEVRTYPDGSIKSRLVKTELIK